MTENEFEKLDVEEAAPEATFSETPKTPETPGGQTGMISSGSAGEVYDWNTAPEGVKAPPRIDMGGKEVTIKKADIILPPPDRPWVTSRSGTSQYKYCTFSLYYDFEGQQEFYSGVRVFKRENDKYSHPTVTRDRNNQASKLLGIYADHKKKDINEVALREFLSYLNSKPKVRIKTEEVTNPTNEDVIKKNFVEAFI